MNGVIKSEFFGATNTPSDVLICYIAGYSTKIKNYARAINVLRRLGYDVLAFDYSIDVFESGNPSVLVAVIETITQQVKVKSKKYQEVICMGASLGAFIAFNVQLRVRNAYVGCYGAGGVGVGQAIFTTRAFRKVAQKFTDNGYIETKLTQTWAEINADPSALMFPDNKSFVIYNGSKDWIVDYTQVARNVELWKSRGMRVRLYRLRGRGHFLATLYFILHTEHVLHSAIYHHATTTSGIIKK